MKLERLIEGFEEALEAFERQMSMPLTSDDEASAVAALEAAMDALTLGEVETGEDWAWVLSMVVRDEPVWRAASWRILALHEEAARAKLMARVAQIDLVSELEVGMRLALGLLAVLDVQVWAFLFDRYSPQHVLSVLAVWLGERGESGQRWPTVLGESAFGRVLEALESLQEPSPSADAGAVMALGALGAAAAAPLALALLSRWSTQPEAHWVCRRAFWALERVGAGAITSEQAEVLLGFLEGEFAQEALSALVVCGDVVIEPLLPRLAQWQGVLEHRMARAQGVRLLGRLGSAPAREALYDLRADSDIYIRHLAWHALASCEDEGLFDALIDVAQGDDVVDRDEARHVLSRLRDARVEAALERWVSECDDDWERDELEQWLEAWRQG